MGVNIDTVHDSFPQMRRAIKALNGKYVSVGVRGEQAWLAGIHEYGCHIPVTDKMRRYLASKGLYLKESTTEIIIPERSFLRTGYDESKEEVLKTVDGIVGNVVSGQMPPEVFFDMIGLLMKSKIQDFAEDLKEPKNHPFTIEQKNSSNPLIDTGDMINAISYEVEE